MSPMPLGILAASGLTSSIEAAFFAAGRYTQNFDKMPFATEVSSLSGNVFSKTLGNVTGAVSSDANGYLGGGNDGSNNIADIVKLSGSTGTTTILAATLSVARNMIGSVSTLTAGYFGGGGIGGNNGYNVIDKITFSSDTSSTLSATLTLSCYGNSGAQNESIGYIAQGFDGSFRNQVDKLTFSNETTSSLGSLLSRTGYGTYGTESENFAYIAGGRNGSTFYSNVDKIAFANDTRSNLSNTLASAVSSPMANKNFNVSFYVAGGITSGGEISTNNKYDVATESRTTLSNSLAAARADGGGFSL